MKKKVDRLLLFHNAHNRIEGKKQSNRHQLLDVFSLTFEQHSYIFLMRKLKIDFFFFFCEQPTAIEAVFLFTHNCLVQLILEYELRHGSNQMTFKNRMAQ